MGCPFRGCPVARTATVKPPWTGLWRPVKWIAHAPDYLLIFRGNQIDKWKVIKKILIHLGVYQEKHNQRALPIAEPGYTESEIVPFDDGWPEYEETVIES